ncbi:hypothetical protein EJ02DRAFT_453626 [Clathrospora elynae]|uniref:Thioesterase domain-containing protein n=1 Tax=Clathrospora elynae TaxID=706981 RepID=A0A6A5SSL1_9PLEO|nr:hypothetical protein EJ02DRAFT_453626 [Clathrospora elynae]
MSRVRHLLNRTPFTPCPQFLRQSIRFSHQPIHLDLPFPLQSRLRWSYLWYASILALGITTGLGARHFAAPLGLPLPGSREDELILESLGRDIDALEVVQALRTQSYNLHNDTALRSGPGLTSSGGGGGRKISAYKAWQELDIDFGRGEGGMLGAMSGTRGLGVQRAFWSAETREMVAVVWIGGGLSGWPGVAHGGAIATVFEEVMARMVDSTSVHHPSSLSITYAKPTYSLDFYILRASFSTPHLPQSGPALDPETDLAKSWLGWLSPAKHRTKTVKPTGQKFEIVGTMESIKGDMCAKAKGSFHVPGLSI